MPAELKNPSVSTDVDSQCSLCLFYLRKFSSHFIASFVANLGMQLLGR